MEAINRECSPYRFRKNVLGAWLAILEAENAAHLRRDRITLFQWESGGATSHAVACPPGREFALASILTKRTS